MTSIGGPAPSLQRTTGAGPANREAEVACTRCASSPREGPRLPRKPCTRGSRERRGSKGVRGQQQLPSEQHGPQHCFSSPWSSDLAIFGLERQQARQVTNRPLKAPDPPLMYRVSAGLETCVQTAAVGLVLTPCTLSVGECVNSPPDGPVRHFHTAQAATGFTPEKWGPDASGPTRTDAVCGHRSSVDVSSPDLAAHWSRMVLKRGAPRGR